MSAKTETQERDKDSELQEIGRSAFESIAEMVGKLEAMQQVSECCAAEVTQANGVTLCDACEKACTMEDGDDPDEDAREEAQQAIHEDPLSVQVRSGWYTPGEEAGTPEEFEILLSTGGPATRIVGELNQHGEPTRARLEAQDWFQPWTEYRGAWSNGGGEILLTYARQFTYGEG